MDTVYRVNSPSHAPAAYQLELYGSDVIAMAMNWCCRGYYLSGLDCFLGKFTINNGGI